MTPTDDRGSAVPRLTRYAVLAAVLGLFVFLVTQATKAPGTTAQGDGYISQVFTNDAAGRTATFPLTLKEGDAEHESSHIFGALATVPGVGSARIVLKGPGLEVAFDSSRTSEETIRAVLVKDGYVAASSAAQQ
jgi:copper chaperone CopZ